MPPHLFDMNEDLLTLGLIEDEEIALDEAALVLALLDHPDTDPAPYRDIFAQIAERLAEVAGVATDPRTRGEALAQVIGDEFGLIGDPMTYDDPANADIIGVLDRGVGLPVSLAILYVTAARRMGWSADVLDVPGHVLVLVGAESAPVIVDPFRGGALVGGEQLADMLNAGVSGRIAAVTHVAAMPNRAVLVRLLLNQATRAEASGKGRRALTLYRRMTAIAPAYAQGWWEIARLELADGDVARARRSLSAILEITRETTMRERVTQLLGSLPTG